MRNTTFLGLSVNPKLKEILEVESKKDKRSVSSYAEIIMIEALQSRNVKEVEGLING